MLYFLQHYYICPYLLCLQNRPEYDNLSIKAIDFFHNVCYNVIIIVLMIDDTRTLLKSQAIVAKRWEQLR